MNLSIDTLAVDDATATLVLVAYMALLAAFALFAKRLLGG